MPEKIVTYQEIKDLLDINMQMLSTKIDANRDLMSMGMKELKDDTEEIKVHAKETNGQVKRNKDSIIVIEEQQKHEARRRKHVFAMAIGAFISVIGTVSAFIIDKIAKG